MDFSRVKTVWIPSLPAGLATASAMGLTDRCMIGGVLFECWLIPQNQLSNGDKALEQPEHSGIVLNEFLLLFGDQFLHASGSPKVRWQYRRTKKHARWIA